jgi:AraC-like DNA-binding protein
LIKLFQKFGPRQGRDREMALLPAKISEAEIDREFIKELDAVIEKNMEDLEFNVEQLAKKLYMDRSTLYRKVLAITGETPADYIRLQRLRRGAQLLESNFGDVTAVAMEVGFSSRFEKKCDIQSIVSQAVNQFNLFEFKGQSNF